MPKGKSCEGLSSQKEKQGQRNDLPTNQKYPPRSTTKHTPPQKTPATDPPTHTHTHNGAPTVLATRRAASNYLQRAASNWREGKRRSTISTSLRHGVSSSSASSARAEQHDTTNLPHTHQQNVKKVVPLHTLRQCCDGRMMQKRGCRFVF